MNEQLVCEAIANMAEVLDGSGLDVAEAMTAVVSLMTSMVDQVAQESGSTQIVDVTLKHIHMAFDEIPYPGVGALH